MYKHIMIFLLLAGAALANPTALQYYQQGNAAMQKSAYDEAIKAYEAALGTGYECAELYYNLGNAFFRRQELGKAILNYERARALKPADPDIAFNLDLAQLRVVDKIAAPPPFFAGKVWSGIKHLLSAGQWGVLAVVVFNLLLATVIIRLLVGQGGVRAVAGYLFLPLLVLFLLAGSLFWATAHDARSLRYGIIMPPKVSVLSAPASDATQVFDLHEGTKVRVADRSGAYVKVILLDGKVGWLTRDGVEEI
ncbi:MAG TPA: tetratricopeptide repeat protein [bacterium]|nr:tetratricopeptide repeat protein [bacterium]HPR87399.1 tetratricopeptide repeat protein [bacterium]